MTSRRRLRVLAASGGVGLAGAGVTAALLGAWPGGGPDGGPGRAPSTRRAVAQGPPPVVVALGDSYTAGVGAGRYDASPAACQRSALGYPRVWGRGRPVARLDVAACAGATTAGLRRTQLSAVGPATTLVTVTVGGNDAGFTEVLVRCVLGGQPGCGTALGEARRFVREDLPAALDRTYRAVRTAAPRARVVVLGYPHLFEAVPACRDVGLGIDQLAALNAAADLLDEVIADRARAAGFAFADVRDRFAGHGVCGPAPWINAVVSPLGDAFHPTAQGYALGYAPALEAAVRAAPPASA